MYNIVKAITKLTEAEIRELDTPRLYSQDQIQPFLTPWNIRDFRLRTGRFITAEEVDQIWKDLDIRWQKLLQKFKGVKPS